MSDLAASVVNGKISTTESSSSSSSSNKSSSLDKNAFLNLLVAQMKYQDPLEPTSNTEYISQFATFSQLEEMQNVTAALDMQRASSLVGKYVTMSVTNSVTKATESISGRVDYVESKDGKTYLYINDKPYSIDDLETVWDDDYLDAYKLASSFATTLAALPAKDNLTLDYEKSIAELRSTYDGMSTYQKSFIATSLVTKLTEAEAKIAELKKIAEAESASE
jgi:flagellar basal-body rod modification protein FlgD